MLVLFLVVCCVVCGLWSCLLCDVCIGCFVLEFDCCVVVDLIQCGVRCSLLVARWLICVFCCSLFGCCCRFLVVGCCVWIGC